MYTFIWRHLPGPVVIRAFQVLILVAVVSAVLLFVVFPWAEPHLPRKALESLVLEGGEMPLPAVVTITMSMPRIAPTLS